MKLVSCLANLFGVVIFLIIPYPHLGDIKAQAKSSEESVKNVENFFHTLRNMVKLIPLLAVFESFEYFNEYYYFKSKANSEYFANVLKFLFTLSPLIITGELFDSIYKGLSFTLLHFMSLLSLIFMYFEIKHDAMLLDWLLIVTLSASYISMPVLLLSWVKFHYADDRLVSYSLYGTFYGLVKVVIFLLMDSG